MIARAQFEPIVDLHDRREISAPSLTPQWCSMDLTSDRLAESRLQVHEYTLFGQEIRESGLMDVFLTVA
jgi:hypothetical protein